MKFDGHQQEVVEFMNGWDQNFTISKNDCEKILSGDSYVINERFDDLMDMVITILEMVKRDPNDVSNMHIYTCVELYQKLTKWMRAEGHPNSFSKRSRKSIGRLKVFLQSKRSP